MIMYENTKLMCVVKNTYMAPPQNNDYYAVFSNLSNQQFEDLVGLQNMHSTTRCMFMSNFVVNFSFPKQRFNRSYIMRSGVDYNELQNWCQIHCKNYKLNGGLIVKSRFNNVNQGVILCHFNEKNDILKFKLTYNDIIHTEVKNPFKEQIL